MVVLDLGAALIDDRAALKDIVVDLVPGSIRLREIASISAVVVYWMMRMLGLMRVMGVWRLVVFVLARHW